MAEDDIAYERSPEHEARVRERAYQLWEAAGRPEGAPDEYWHRAESDISAEEENILQGERESVAETLGPVHRNIDESVRQELDHRDSGAGSERAATDPMASPAVIESGRAATRARRRTPVA